MRKIGVRKQRAKFLAKVPLECKGWVKSAYGQQQHLMEGTGSGSESGVENLAQIQYRNVLGKKY